MSLYLEYDKTTRQIKRVITSKDRPNDVAHLSYQNVPDNIFIDLGKSIDEVVDFLIINNISEKNEENQKEEVLFIEV